MLDWIRAHDELVFAMGIVSLVTFLGTLVLVPVLIVRIPTDYFAHDRREHVEPYRHPVLHWVLTIGKNVIGAMLILAGIAMLVLPGQGLLTILIGIIVMDFPGKYVLEKKIAGMSGVLKALNWIRAKGGRPPLRVDRAPGDATR